MSGSYRKIDYRLRPAKSIERKMLAESFRRLSEFGRVDFYRYIGFGSLYFSDFSLFHKLLGFKQMFSIEGTSDPTIQERFEFNRPYNSVEMKFGFSNSELPKLSWDERTIVWLDYDGVLNKSVLDDVALVSSKITNGSLLLISVNANVPIVNSDESEGEPTNPLDVLKKELGLGKVPSTISSADLASWGTAKVYRNIINNEIQETLKNRNGTLSPGNQIKYSQLYNFHYSDNAKMLTVGGIFYDSGQDHIFTKCGFNHLDFYRDKEDSYKIETPLLTFREIRALEKSLPVTSTPIVLPIPSSDINKYEKIYRYFPHFTEADI